MLSVTVDTLADVVDASDGVTSLREAITSAPSSGNEVVFDPSLHGGSIGLNSQLTISQSITISGPGASKLTVDGLGHGRVFHVLPGAGTAIISGLTLTGGQGVQYGGGIFNQATLKLDGVEVVGNRSTVFGGGIYSDGPYLEVKNSTIAHNQAPWGGGVFGSLSGEEWMYIRQSTISNNVADDPNTSNGQGGGIRVGLSSASTVANLTIENSTISNNRAEAHGGGIHLSHGARASIRSATITENRADVYAGGIFNEALPVLMRNTILAGNTAGDAARADGSGSLNGQFGLTSRYNLVGVDHSSFLFAANNSNQLGSAATPLNPRLSPLANLGGPTKVHAPLPQSPVIDHGADGDTGGLTGDQRGSARQIEDSTTPNAPGNTADIGAVEFDARGAVGDFNGDGREDELRFSPTLKSLLVAEKSTASAGWEVGAWGSVALATTPSPYGNGILVGDFNGDGRDDVMVLDAFDYTWLLGISDGSMFHVEELKMNGIALQAGWAYAYIGDFDADGDEELVGKVGGGSNWLAVQHHDDTALSSLTVAQLPGFTPGATVFVQDANRDERDDLITRTSASAPWMVSLGGAAADGSIQFQAAADWDAWIDFGFEVATGKLDADKAMAKVIEEFAWVYNNVELELYPGLMKGPEATRQTKAGNDWDQAALLEERLQALSIFATSDVKIATGKIRATVAEVQKWLGVATPAAAFRVIAAAMDANVKGFDSTNQLVSAPSAASDVSFNATAATLEFTHAWVRASVPTASGIQVVDLDPSWKLKERQVGIPLSPELNLAGGTSADIYLFDEMEYLALDPNADHRLPVEFFEDQVMAWLTANHPGKSLADVAAEGRIVTKSFAQVPVGFGIGVVVADRNGNSVYDSGDFDPHSSLVSITGSAAADDFTHRVFVKLKKGAAEHWSKELSVPLHSLDSIQITFGDSLGAVTNPQQIATTAASQFFGRLVVDGAVLASATTTAHYFTSSDTATVELVHLSPTALVKAKSGNPAGPTENDRIEPFSERPYEIIGIGLDANQHSRDSLAALQSHLLAAIATATSETALRDDIDDLVSYSAAKYWHDFNLHNRSIELLTQTVGAQQWVGSGIVKADPVLLVDPQSPIPGIIEYLSYGMAPRNFGVDLPNINHLTLEGTRGALHDEAWQLVGYNSSALEHSVVEEVISASSISTMKGLQRAFRQNLGLDVNIVVTGTAAFGSDVMQVYESKVENNVRQPVFHTGDWRTVNGAPSRINGSNTLIDAVTDLTDPTTGKLRNHVPTTNLGQTIWNIFQNLSVSDGDVRIMVPFARTNLGRWEGGVFVEKDNWLGGVYVVEKASSMSFIIEGGTPSSGGYSGNKPIAPPKELPRTNFVNASWAGDPVNVANGNMFRDETDIIYPNLGVPLTFSRHYDSQSKDDIGLGVGWTHSFGDLLYFDPKDPADSQDSDAIVWLDAGGRRHRFEKLLDGTYQTPSGLTGKFTAINVSINSGTVGFTFEDSTGMTYRFDRLDDPSDGVPDTPNLMRHADGASVVIVGRLREQVDRNGDGVAVKYKDGATTGRTISHVHDVHSTGVAPARRLAFANPAGVITEVAKYDGGLVGAWNFAFTDVIVTGVASAKRLIWADAPSVPVANAAYVDAATRPRVLYGYNNVADHYAKGLITRITEADETWHEYEYYRNRRVFRVLQGESTESLADPSGGSVDLSGFTGVGNLSAPNAYTAATTAIGGTMDARRYGSEGAAYLADVSLAVPGILTSSTAGGFGASGTLIFDAQTSSGSVDPGFQVGFFDKDNLSHEVYGFTVADSSSTAFRFISTHGVDVVPGSGAVVNQGTYTFEIDVNNADSGAGMFRLRLKTLSSTVVMDVISAIPSGATQADSFGFLQPLLASGSNETFAFTISNFTYTGETRLPLNLPEIASAIDVQTFNYNILRGQTDFTDERGNTETYLHQKNGLLQKQIHADRSHTKTTWGTVDTPQEFLMTSTTDERGAVETFTYYGSGDNFKQNQLKESKEKHYPSQASTALVTQYDYVQPNAAKPQLVSLSTVVVDPSSTVTDPGDGSYVGQKLTTTNVYYPTGDAVGKLWKRTDARQHD